MHILENVCIFKISLKYFWFSDFSLWSSEKMKLLFWKLFDSDCRQINGIENNWFSEFSEMIFIFLENENENGQKGQKCSLELKISLESHWNLTENFPIFL